MIDQELAALSQKVFEAKTRFVAAKVKSGAAYEEAKRCENEAAGLASAVWEAESELLKHVRGQAI